MDPLIENLKATTHAICRYLWAQFAHFGLILINKLFHKHREQRFRPRPGLAGTAGGPQKQPEQRSAALGMVVFGAHGHSGPDYQRIFARIAGCRQRWHPQRSFRNPARNWRSGKATATAA